MGGRRGEDGARPDPDGQEAPPTRRPTGRPGGGLRLLALDVGGRRIGIAISDETGAIASPIGNVERGRGDVAALRRIIAERTVGRLIVGLPRGLSGREGPQAADVRAYADRLATDLGLPLEYWDERLTTAMAERALIESGTRRAARRERVDAVAAALILQSYLDAARHRASRAGRHAGGGRDDDGEDG